MLKENPLIQERVTRLQSIGGVGEVTASTWVLEVGEVERFGAIRQAVSYCGLCAAQKESAGKKAVGQYLKNEINIYKLF